MDEDKKREQLDAEISRTPSITRIAIIQKSDSGNSVSSQSGSEERVFQGDFHAYYSPLVKDDISALMFTLNYQKRVGGDGKCPDLFREQDAFRLQSLLPPSPDAPPQLCLTPASRSKRSLMSPGVPPSGSSSSSDDGGESRGGKRARTAVLEF